MRSADKVFFNTPYDEAYEPLFAVLVGSAIALQLIPKCVLEISEQGQGRLERIASMLNECAFSIHDLSRCDMPPRFNMPFELGLTYGLRRNKKVIGIVVLESEAHRLQKHLSDFNGIDPFVHSNERRKLGACMLDAFEDDALMPTKAYFEFLDNIELVRSRISQDFGSLFTRSAFKRLRQEALNLAILHGFIAKD